MVAILNFRKKIKLRVFTCIVKKKDAAQWFRTAQRGRSSTEHITPHYNYRTVVYVCVEGTGLILVNAYLNPYTSNFVTNSFCLTIMCINRVSLVAFTLTSLHSAGICTPFMHIIHFIVIKYVFLFFTELFSA